MSVVLDLVNYMEKNKDKDNLADIDSNMGLDDLSQAFQLFSESTAKMEAMYNSLEKRVAELTEELESKNRELEQANRLASLGELSAGVAHEIRNPLAGIELSASLLKRTLVEDKQNELLGNIVSSVGRINNIVMNLLTFARGAKIELRTVEIKKIIDEAVLALAMDAKYSAAKVSINVTEQLPQVKGDPGQLRQVFINFFQNAIEAMDNGGVVDLSLTVEPSDDVSNSYLKIVIADNGVGMSKDTQDKIFNPFYTTKDMGTGLGMAISYRIIENHGGRVKVESELGKGTAFTIELPLLIK